LRYFPRVDENRCFWRRALNAEKPRDAKNLIDLVQRAIRACLEPEFWIGAVAETDDGARADPAGKHLGLGRGGR
jgi:hypothetical protein